MSKIYAKYTGEVVSGKKTYMLVNENGRPVGRDGDPVYHPVFTLGNREGYPIYKGAGLTPHAADGATAPRQQSLFDTAGDEPAKASDGTPRR